MAIQQRKKDSEKENERLRSEQEEIEKKWMQAQQDFEKSPGSAQRAVSEAYLKSRNAWRETYQVALELNENAMLLLDREEAWIRVGPNQIKEYME